ncbi:MAG: hypothetical protein WBA46_14165, partial [Thermomicrobiales bacterium]
MPRDSFSSVPAIPTSPATGSLHRRRFLHGAAGIAFAAALAGSGTVFTGSGAFARTKQDAAPLDDLQALLALVPASLATDALGSGTLFYHADLKAQFDALGVDRTVPDWLDGIKLVPTTMSLALASRVYPYALSEVVAEGLGFAPLAVDRTLEVGVLPPDSLSIFQGGLDRARMEAAWEDWGYEPVSLDDGFTLWTMGEEGELDLSDELMHIGLGSFNNLLMLDDDTLVMSRLAKTVHDVA